MKYIFKILSVIFILSSLVLSQEENQIEAKKSELYNLRTEIAQLEDELSQKSQKEKESFEVLENYNKQAFLINKVINQLRKEEKILQKEIKSIELKIKSIENEISLLQRNYAKYVVALYKKGSYNELESIVNAESLRQAVIRIEYLRRFSQRRKSDLEELKQKKKELFAEKNKLEIKKKEKSLLVAEKKADENKLKVKLNERKEILSSIKKDKETLQKTIAAKKESQEQVKSLIAKLVEEAERKKREEELRRQRLLASKEGNIVNETDFTSEDNSGFDYALNNSLFSSFAELQGNMPWPLRRGKIVKAFGKNRNEALNTVTINYGVDISSTVDLSVRCVADGIISAIDWLPGYGSVIIVTHKGDYRTVYSHLSEIYVDEADTVKAGNVIAKVGESIEGNILHFEIWNSRENQNPEVWLAKK